MLYNIDRIFLSSTLRNERINDPTRAITDVIVRMENGELYSASFFSYRAIDDLYNKHLKNGEYLSGNYFWTKGMVLIEKCEEGSIKQVVEFLIEEGDFQNAFTKLD